MKSVLSSLDITQRTYATLISRWRELLPLIGWLALVFGAANLARGLFPGVYVFDPFDTAWLRLPEAVCCGPVLALLHHRLLDTGRDFAWSRDNRLVKFLKAAFYYYVLSILFQVGTFAATQAVPALLGYVLGPSAGPLYPLVVGVSFVAFAVAFARLSLAYAFLSGDFREPMMRSILATKGKGYRIVSCLLLPAAPVIIPWVALSAYGGDWLAPNLGHGLRPLSIMTTTLMQVVGALLISSGLCAIFTALAAQGGDHFEEE